MTDTHIRLKEVTEPIMAEHFDGLQDYKAHESYSAEQSEALGQALSDSGLVEAILRKVAGDRGGIDAGSLTVTTFVFAFQLGRQFEVREMARAMRREV